MHFGKEPERVYVDYSEWPEMSVEYLLDASKQNMHEMQKELERLSMRGKSLKAFMGISLSMFTAALALDTDPAIFLTYAGFVLMFASLFFMLLTDHLSKDDAAVDFLAGGRDGYAMYEDPDVLRGDLINRFMWRCDDARNTIKEISQQYTVFTAAFLAGLAMFIASVLMSL